MLQIVNDGFFKSAQIFPNDVSKSFALERLKKLVMSASSAALKAFKKHITPQLRLMEPAFRLNIRMTPVEQVAYSREFFGVPAEK